MRYPTTPDVFGFQSIYDYNKMIKLQAGMNKVVSSKKSFTKKENKMVKTHMHRMQNK